MRALRLVIGVLVLAQGLSTGEWIFAILGALFALMPLFNIGCGTTSQCASPSRNVGRQTNDTNFEEIK